MNTAPFALGIAVGLALTAAALISAVTINVCALMMLTGAVQ